MRARLRQLVCPDVDDLEKWSPPEGPFGIGLVAKIGPSDADGEESFGMTLCTPEWFAAQRMRDQTIRSGTQTLFVKRYDYRAIKAFIERAVARAEGDTWTDVANKLSWLGHWEFASYRPYLE